MQQIPHWVSGSYYVAAPKFDAAKFSIGSVVVYQVPYAALYNKRSPD
jgi:hypothetical protein